MRITVRPLQWVGPVTKPRRRSQFDSAWSATAGLLGHELRKLHASRVVLQVDVRESDIRLDGQIRANAQPATPAVRLVFDTPAGPMAFSCDRFTTWQDNARAIALGLEALRKIDRYGIARGQEQYKGYLAVEAGGGTVADARSVLARWAGDEVTSEDSDQTLRARYRKARAAAHPDRHGGDQTAWDQIEAAARALGLS